MDLKGKKVTVVGLGNSGLNACRLLKDAGAIVKATDSGDSPPVRALAEDLRIAGIDAEARGHTEGYIKGAELVVVSPGVEDNSAAVKWANRFGIPVIGEMELGFRFCKGRIVAVTGTNGKSTVTTLIGDFFKKGGLDSVVCGNIGNSLCGEIPRIKEATWVVLEVSSFQLEKIEFFKPHIALILNITDDHMDRYKKFDDYFNEKLKIFRNQDDRDILILNHDALPLRRLKDMTRSKALFYSRTEKTNGAYIENETIICNVSGKEKRMLEIDDVALKGAHNIENVLASVLAAALAGVSEDAAKQAIRNFRGLDHRFETVRVLDGVEYIDDSKGTTVDSTCRALEACAGPVVLIAGGKDKHSRYSAASNIMRKKVKHLILMGEASGAIRSALRDAVDIRDASDMREAVEIARGLAKKGYHVLLSPMCSSFDMFSSYKERGDVFKKAVNGLNI